MYKTVYFLLFLYCSPLAADNVKAKDGVNLFGNEFPWELVIDRGKIQGCIYDNKFYSIGSILIEETLPRKCGLNSSREGYWSELSDSELDLFKASIKEQEKLENESINIGGKPISPHEARIIRYMRMSQTNFNKQ